MFSLHIDTARTWRGGQNQVLVTVMGLRGLGHRTMLVAHPGGELRQRAREGLDLIPLAPKTEMDLGAAWRLSRLLKQLKPDVVHAHDPHGVAMAALALSMSTQLAKAWQLHTVNAVAPVASPDRATDHRTSDVGPRTSDLGHR